MSTLKTNTIQAATGTTVNVASGQVLTQPGSVIQVQHGILTSSFTTTGSNFQDTGLSCAITPKLQTSKMLVFSRIYMVGQYFTCHANLVRTIGGSSINLNQADAASNRNVSTFVSIIDDASSSNHGIAVPDSTMAYDTPNTTSQITYKVQVRSRPDNTSQIVYFNRSEPDRDNTTYDSRQHSVITVWEIAQ